MLQSERLNGASSVEHISPQPCNLGDHFLLHQWLRWSIIRGPVMENNDCFWSLVCVSPASPPPG